MNTPASPSRKPLLRGHLHQSAFFFSLGACSILISHTQNHRTMIAAIIYSLSLCGLFGISALYHRPYWSQQKRRWMRRLDHSAIFVLIAGTSTPIYLIGLPPQMGEKMLTVTWLVTLFGVLQSLFWSHAPKWVSALIYLSAGWWIVPYLPELKASLSYFELKYLFLGGVAYSVGALIYALKRPNPFPKTFGHHEIFHLLVIVGAFLHFIVIHSIITNSYHSVPSEIQS